MTSDQLIRIVEALAWPIAALVIVSKLYVLAETISDDWIRQAVRWDKLVSGLHGYWSAIYHERTNHDTRLVDTAEKSLLALIQTNGGLPAARGDKIGRQLVREIREMYRELETPTHAPASTAQGSALAVPGDDLMLDEPDADDEHDTYTSFDLEEGDAL